MTNSNASGRNAEEAFQAWINSNDSHGRPRSSYMNVAQARVVWMASRAQYKSQLYRRICSSTLGV